MINMALVNGLHTHIQFSPIPPIEMGWDLLITESYVRFTRVFAYYGILLYRIQCHIRNISWAQRVGWAACTKRNLTCWALIVMLNSFTENVLSKWIASVYTLVQKSYFFGNSKENIKLEIFYLFFGLICVTVWKWFLRFFWRTIFIWETSLSLFVDGFDYLH